MEELEAIKEAEEAALAEAEAAAAEAANAAAGLFDFDEMDEEDEEEDKKSKGSKGSKKGSPAKPAIRIEENGGTRHQNGGVIIDTPLRNNQYNTIEYQVREIQIGTRGAVLHHSAEMVLCFRNFFFFSSKYQQCSG